MRILHVITTLDPGGAENHLRLLCRELRAHHELMVVFLKGEGRLAHAFEEMGIEVVPLLLRHTADPGMPRRLRRVCERFRPDVVHTHLFKADFYGAWALRKQPTALVSSKHNEDPELRAGLFGVLGRRTLRRADAVLCISEAVRRHVAHHGQVEADRLHLVHYGFDVEEFEARDEHWDLRGELDVPADAPLALFVGRLAAQKGLNTLMAAWAIVARQVPQARLVLVGDGPLHDAVLADVERHELQPCVRLGGFRHEVKAALQASDLLVLPSRWEGFGLVLVEAMAAGRAVVGSTAGAIPEVVAEGETGLLSAPGDPEALAANLTSLLDDRERARRMGEAGRQRVLDEFGVAKMIERTDRVYEHALERRAAKR